MAHHGWLEHPHRKYIGSFMVDFPASHVRFRGGVCVFLTRIDQGELDLSAFEGNVVLLKGF